MLMSISRLAAVLGIALLVGCRSVPVPIENVAPTPVAASTTKAVTAEQVRGAIIRAGAGLGWTVVDGGPGVLLGSIALRTHTAHIEIPYSAQSWAINYKSSTNLNAEPGKIHRNYNGWIQNLDRAIRAQLATL